MGIIIVKGYTGKPVTCRDCGSDRMKVTPKKYGEYNSSCPDCGQPIYHIVCADCGSTSLDEGIIVENDERPRGRECWPLDRR